MWGVQGTLPAPRLSAASGLRLASSASRRCGVERLATRGARVAPVFGHLLVVECKDKGLREGKVDMALDPLMNARAEGIKPNVTICDSIPVIPKLQGKKRSCECHDQYNALVPYVDAWKWQQSCVEEKRAILLGGGGEDFDDTLILLQHPPVYTLGTRSSEANLKFDAKDPPFELHRTERGGEVTYHGPGQLVMYPILNLRHHKLDLHWYLRTLEEVVICALDKACGIQAHRIDGLTGVWVDNQKVAAIGVRVSRWITYHGLALNVTTDLSPFSNIIPCGISDYSVTSVAKLLQIPSQENAAAERLLELLHDCLLEEFALQFNLHFIPPTRPGPQPVYKAISVTPVC